MVSYEETRRAGERERASKGIDLAVDPSEDKPSPLCLQARRLCRRFGLTASIAAVVAELAFQNGRPA